MRTHIGFVGCRDGHDDCVGGLGRVSLVGPAESITTRGNRPIGISDVP